MNGPDSGDDSLRAVVLPGCVDAVFTADTLKDGDKTDRDVRENLERQDRTHAPQGDLAESVEV